MTQQLWTNVPSESLDMRTSVTVITPEGGAIKPQPRPDREDPGLLILLHGLTGNNQQWPVRTDLAAIADKYNLVLVLPDGQRSFWIDQEYGLAWGEWVGQELPRVIRESLRISTKRDDTFIGGLSMGGYGAVRAAFDYPRTFAGAFSLSGTLNAAEPAFRGRHPDLFKIGFGNPDAPRPKDDLIARLRDGSVTKSAALALQDDPSAPMTKFFVTCGEGDRLMDQNTRFVEAGDNAGIDITWESGPGVHNFRFWNQWLPAAVDAIVRPNRTA